MEGIEALEKLVRTNVMLALTNVKNFKVARHNATILIGPTNGEILDFYFAGKKNYAEYNLDFIDSSINIQADGSVSFCYDKESYEIHRTENTMPKNVMYSSLSKNAYMKKFAEENNHFQ